MSLRAVPSEKTNSTMEEGVFLSQFFLSFSFHGFHALCAKDHLRVFLDMKLWAICRSHLSNGFHLRSQSYITICSFRVLLDNSSFQRSTDRFFWRKFELFGLVMFILFYSQSQSLFQQILKKNNILMRFSFVFISVHFHL